jgi:hypothetical protein
MTSTETTLPTGGAWAAVLAAAIGCAGFALVSDLSEASKSIKKILSIYSPAGDLSGKSTLGVIVWLLAWAILHARWKNRVIRRPGRITAISAILILLALIMVFPPFVELFAAE